MSIRVFLYFLFIVAWGCSFAESQSVIIKGVNYIYKIPNEYIKLNNSIIDFHGLTVDTAKSISLLIPSSYFFSSSKNDDLAVLMFLE